MCLLTMRPTFNMDSWRRLGKLDHVDHEELAGGSGVENLCSDERTRKVFSTNFFGAMNLTWALLPHLRERRTGTILFMSSLLAWEALPTSGAYAATKGALESA